MAAPRARVLERVERVVAAAADALAELGDAVTTEDVVRRSGVSRRVILSMFGSFDDLVMVAFDATTEGRTERQRQAFAEHAGDPVAQLRETTRVRWRWFEGEPMMRARARAVRYGALRPVQRKADFELSMRVPALSLSATIAELRRLGRLRPEELSDDELADVADRYIRGRLTDRVLAVADDVESLPPDPEGFEDTWRVLRGLLVTGDGDQD